MIILRNSSYICNRLRKKENSTNRKTGNLLAANGTPLAINGFFIKCKKLKLIMHLRIASSLSQVYWHKKILFLSVQKTLSNDTFILILTMKYEHYKMTFSFKLKFSIGYTESSSNNTKTLILKNYIYRFHFFSNFLCNWRASRQSR